MKYTEEMKAWLVKNIPGVPYCQVLEKFNAYFDTSLNLKALRSTAKRLGVVNGLDGKFKKNNPPWNKGKKGYIGPNKTSFKKGNIPPNTRKIGSERIDVDGYTLVKVKSTGKYKWQLKHRLIWEKYYKKKIPSGYALIFADQDKTNFNIENLILISRRELVALNKKNRLTSSEELSKVGIQLTKLELQIVDVKRNKRRKNDIKK